MGFATEMGLACVRGVEMGTTEEERVSRARRAQKTHDRECASRER